MKYLHLILMLFYFKVSVCDGNNTEYSENLVRDVARDVASLEIPAIRLNAVLEASSDADLRAVLWAYVLNYPERINPLLLCWWRQDNSESRLFVLILLLCQEHGYFHSKDFEGWAKKFPLHEAEQRKAEIRHVMKYNKQYRAQLLLLANGAKQVRSLFE